MVLSPYKVMANQSVVSPPSNTSLLSHLEPALNFRFHIYVRESTKLAPWVYVVVQSSLRTDD